MSQPRCLDEIPPLLLSDTFNTWFNATNKLIELSNTITIRGLDLIDTINLEEGDPLPPVIGLKLTNLGFCYLQLEFVPGPFIGHVTGGATSVYGDGSSENPYKATVVFPSSDNEDLTMPDEDLTGDDYFIVKDTSDIEFPIKQISSQGVKTKVFGGNKIVVSPTGPNGFTISWVDLQFIPTFTINPSGGDKFIGTGTYRNDQSVTFTIGVNNNTNVGVNNSTISFTDLMGGSGFDPIPFNGIGSTASPSLTIPSANNTFGYGSGSLVERIRFRAVINSQTSSTTGIPFQQESKTLEQSVMFGWRFRFFVSQNPDLNNTNVSLTGANTSGPTNAQRDVRGRPISTNNLTVSRPGSNPVYYMYFIYSDRETNQISDYNWFPTLYNNGIAIGAPDANGINAWINKGITSFSSGDFTGESFRVLRMRNSITDQNFSFAIGGNATYIPPIDQ